MLAVTLAAFCAAKAMVRSVPEVEYPDEPFKIPLKLGEWSGEEIPLEEGPTLDDIGVDWRTYRRYHRGGAFMELLVEYNRPGSAREHTPDHCVRGRGWLWTTREDTQLEVPDRPGAFPVTATTMENDGQTAGLIYWYQLGNRPFANHVKRKVSAIGRVLMLRPPLPKAGVRIIAAAPGAKDEQLVAMAKEFAALVAPYVTFAGEVSGASSPG